MKEEQFDKELMDHLDGIAAEITNIDAHRQAAELKKIISELKALPLEKADPGTDKRMYQFIEKESASPIPVLKLKKWLPYISAAAGIIIMFFIFPDANSIEEDYQLLHSNPDKLSFIYNLNKQQLGSEDIGWLKEQLRKEDNPNIRVTIVDVLNNYQSGLDHDFFNNLQQESVPSVQMALLNALEHLKNPDLSNELLAFSQRKDLDHTVKLRALDILSNQSKKY